LSATRISRGFTVLLEQQRYEITLPRNTSLADCSNVVLAKTPVL
jgi:hypothetical protein